MNIAIIGGSITEGEGASNFKNAYIYKLEQYFKEKNKDSIIKNLGAGGTASQFGIFRLKRDLGDFKPDLIFIEFAINDRIYSSYDSSIYFEGLIRECLKITNKIIIIDFPTEIKDSCTSIHKKIAYYYNIPTIDVQDKIFQKTENGNFKWSDISKDNIHPNDKGHELYYEIIKENLENIDLEKLNSTFDNKILTKYRFNNPRIAYCEEVEFYGKWREEYFKLNNKFDNAAITDSIGDGLIFRFKGKCLAMMNLLTEDSGILECELDNYIFNIDLYSEGNSIFNTTINLNNLKNKEHILVMKVSKKRNDKSAGNKAIVGGFLIDN